MTQSNVTLTSKQISALQRCFYEDQLVPNEEPILYGCWFDPDSSKANIRALQFIQTFESFYVLYMDYIQVSHDCYKPHFCLFASPKETTVSIFDIDVLKILNPSTNVGVVKTVVSQLMSEYGFLVDFTKVEPLTICELEAIDYIANYSKHFLPSKVKIEDILENQISGESLERNFLMSTFFNKKRMTT